MAETKKTEATAPETEKAETSPKTEATAPETEQMEEIRLSRTPGKGDLFVAINGRSFQIKRGVKVSVPKHVAEFIRQQEEQDEHTQELIDELSKVD